jgi:hypothetical protein
MEQRTANEVMTQRAETMQAIEQFAEELTANGQRRAWSETVKDPELRRFAKEVNGPLMEILAQRIKYHDRECVDLFKTGATLVGKLHRQQSNSVFWQLAAQFACIASQDRQWKAIRRGAQDECAGAYS